MSAATAPGFEAFTDAEGHFEIAGSPPAASTWRPPHRLRQAASAGDRDRARARSRWTSARSLSSRASGSRGSSSDRDGQPLEGVEVRVERERPGDDVHLSGRGPGEAEPDATSDPGGWFVVEDLARPGPGTTLSLSRSGYVQTTASARVETAARRAAGSRDGPGLERVGSRPRRGRRAGSRAPRSASPGSRRVEMGGNVMVALMMEGADQ